MNLLDSYFLCLDIGKSGVRGIAHRVQNGIISQSATASCDNFDTIFAIKSVIDDIEHRLKTHFDSAYITGNFGPSIFEITRKQTVWNAEHKINGNDIKYQISQIKSPDNFYPLSIIPLQYDTSISRNISNPIGFSDKQLVSTFGIIFYNKKFSDEFISVLRQSHIQLESMFEPHFVLNSTLRTRGENTLFIDLGASFSSVSLWTDKGPVLHKKLNPGMNQITMDLAKTLNIDFDEAERIKKMVSCLIPKDIDRFTPADTTYEFSRADVNDIIIPTVVDIIGKIKETTESVIQKFPIKKIFISGGGTQIEGLIDFFENAFGIPCHNISTDANAIALSKHIWNLESEHRTAFIEKHEKINKKIIFFQKLFKQKQKKQKIKFIPILPSTLCFNMNASSTYTLFKAANISIIHVDIMDGFYVDKITGGIPQLKNIRANTNAHLHVHLMTENPTIWASNAIAAGADTIILSTNTSGVHRAIRGIKLSGKRVGIALNPDSSVTILKPILRDIDEVMIMAVKPGAAGQEFNKNVLHKISILATTRKKYGLKYTISVDGGINEETAKLCWDAGADLLISGSYLAKSNDFVMAIQNLIKSK